ncbi:MAG: hypothetical protein HFJ84_02995 [Clostridiales bacterium]|jgi:hypothetical protein|nr:hypothetical protein [Clostridiales bacterium]
MMDYHKWSQQYQEEAQRIREHIQALKKEAAGNSTDHNWNGRIYTLYSMYLECKHTAELLEEYAQRQNRQTWMEKGSV